ncbi:MAG: DUF427 domain-containing protein [Bacteroidota bacterium]
MICILIIEQHLKMPKKKSTSQTSIPQWIQKARAHWKYTGEKRPAFAEEPKDGQRSVWDFPRPPALEPTHKMLEVKHNNDVLAYSQRALAVLETASPPTYYVPPEDVVFQKLVPVSGKTSFCEWKGAAQYWALKTKPLQAVAWSYEKPLAPFEELKDYLAFYPQYLDCYLDQERVIPQPGGFYAGWITSDLAGPFKGEPGSSHW